MTLRAPVIHQLWWRHNTYRYYRGAIVPAGGRPEEYDAWARYEEARKTKGEVAPYQSLINIAQKYAPDLAEKIRTRDKLLRRGFYPPPWAIAMSFDLSERQVGMAAGELISWCCKNGPLGILPLRALEIRCEPRWYTGTKNTDTGSKPIRYLEAPYFQCDRGVWVKHYRGQSLESPTAAEQEADALKAFRQIAPPGATVLSAGLSPDMTEEITIDVLMTSYFRQLPAARRRRGRISSPLTPSFRSTYSESVSEMLRYGLLLYAYILEITGALRTYGELSVNLLLRSAKHVRKNAAGDIQTTFRFPSLVCLFAEMILSDNCTGSRSGFCSSCGAAFVTTSPQTLYCSERCAWRDRKRRARS